MAVITPEILLESHWHRLFVRRIAVINRYLLLLGIPNVKAITVRALEILLGDLPNTVERRNAYGIGSRGLRYAKRL